MTSWFIHRLNKAHDRSSFCCGNSVLDGWLKERAGQYDRRDLSRTFVATLANENRVLGYYALSTHRVLFDALPHPESTGMPQLDIPVILLGRLAVDQSYQGKGLGAFLLIDALRRSSQISEKVGILAIEVEAIDDNVSTFYLKFGFRSLLDDDKHLFLPMHEVRKLKIDS
ncbi:GNAT family N-acetyltransferase [Pirellulaceae bacterium SH449]